MRLPELLLLLALLTFAALYGDDTEAPAVAVCSTRCSGATR